MLLNLTDISSEPLQQQIIRQIRAKILTGELPDGSSLPSIRSLARENHVSVITVQRAYETLTREELIHSRRGKGFFVAQINGKRKKDMAIERIRENIEPLIESALAEGLTAEDIIGIVTNITNKNNRSKSRG